MHEIHKRVNAQEAAKEVKPDDDDRAHVAVGQRPKGFLFKGTPFLRGNAQDKLKINELQVSIIIF